MLEKNTRFKLYMVLSTAQTVLVYSSPCFQPIHSRVLQHDEVCDTRHTQLRKGRLLKDNMSHSWEWIFILSIDWFPEQLPLPPIIYTDPLRLDPSTLLSLIHQAGREKASGGAWIDILLGPGVYPAEVNFDFRLCCGITSCSPTSREQWE